MENFDLLFIVVFVGYKGLFVKVKKNIKRNIWYDSV